MFTLYEFALSGNCRKIRLMLSLLGLDYRSIVVNGSERQQNSADFLSINPFGQVPALTDDNVIVRGSQVILVYLAGKYGKEHWLAADHITIADIPSFSYIGLAPEGRLDLESYPAV